MHITLVANLDGLPTLHLRPGQSLIGSSPKASMHFVSGQDGLQLSTDNRVENPRLVTDPDRRAIFNDTTVESLGRLAMRDLDVTGVVQLLVREKVRGGHVEAHDIDIEAADARGYEERPEVALFSVIGVRLMHVAYLARVHPEVPATEVFSQEEIEALHVRVHHALPPAQSPSLREVVRMIGNLGGHLLRKGDGEPGMTVIWRGWLHLYETVIALRAARLAGLIPSS